MAHSHSHPQRQNVHTQKMPIIGRSQAASAKIVIIVILIIEFMTAESRLCKCKLATVEMRLNCIFHSIRMTVIFSAEQPIMLMLWGDIGNRVESRIRTSYALITDARTR